MTIDQKEAEASFAEKVYRELSEPGPETRRKIGEAIWLRRQSKAANLLANPTKPKR